MYSNGDVTVMQHSALKPSPLSLGINVERPKFPQYAMISKRSESFASWPNSLPVKPDDLVEAGLVYTGVGDSVRCYHCGGGLRNWEEGDSPMEEHAKWYPSCPHVLLNKGQTYIDRLHSGESPVPDVRDTEQEYYRESLNYLTTIPAQSCIQMGYSNEMVEKAIHIYMNQNKGNDDFKGRDLCLILLDMEDDAQNQGSFEVAIEEPENRPDCVEKVAVDSGTSSTCSSEQLQDLLEENLKLKENQSCKICLDKVADVIFLPCGHMVSSPQCAPALAKCPICRTAIKGQIKAFFATS